MGRTNSAGVAFAIVPTLILGASSAEVSRVVQSTVTPAPMHASVTSLDNSDTHKRLVHQRAQQLLPEFERAVKSEFPGAVVRLEPSTDMEDARWVFSVRYNLGDVADITDDILAKDESVFDSYMSLIDGRSGHEYRAEYGFSRWFA